MAEVNMGTLYEYNKSIMENMTALSKNQVKKILRENVVDFLKETDNTYYMMLCKEASDYTVFRISEFERIPAAVEELRLCLEERGECISIEKDINGAFEIWIRANGWAEHLENGHMYAYYLFPYDAAIIEV